METSAKNYKNIGDKIKRIAFNLARDNKFKSPK